MKPLILTGTIVLIVGITWIIITMNNPSIPQSNNLTPTPTSNLDTTPSPTQRKQSMVTYESTYGNLQFQYPSGYFIKESDQRTSDQPQYTIVLFEDTQENRDLVEGRNTTPREGPPTITVDIYANSQNLTPSQWIKKSTYWDRIEKDSDTLLSGTHAEIYNFDGLYAGKLTIAAKDDFMYIFSVGWTDPNAQMVRDYDMVINAVQFN